MLSSIFFLWLAARNVDFRLLPQNVARFHIGGTILALVVWWSGYVIRGWRWQILLKPLDRVRWRDSAMIIVVGFAVNTLLPLRAGEFARAYLIHRVAPKVSKSAGFATVAAERVLDGLAVVTATILGSYAITTPAWSRDVITIAAFIFGASFIIGMTAVRYPTYAQRIIAKLLSPAPEKAAEWVMTFFDKCVQGLGSFRSVVDLMKLLALTMWIWFFEIFFVYMTLLSFSVPITFLQAAFIMGIINLSVMIPAAPGGVGTVEYATVLGLGLIGISESVAFGYGLVTHVLTSGSVLFAGLVLIHRFGISVGGVLRNAERSADDS